MVLTTCSDGSVGGKERGKNRGSADTTRFGAETVPAHLEGNGHYLLPWGRVGVQKILPLRRFTRIIQMDPSPPNDLFLYDMF